MAAETDRQIIGWRLKLRKIIFDHDTPAARAFDIALLWCIVLSVAAVVLESIDGISRRYGDLLVALEWCFTLLFAVEYLLRLATVARPWLYARSFFGIVDLVAVLPTFLAVIVPGAQYFLIVRIIRILRVFRILKLVRFLGEAQVLLRALKLSLPKISVFLGTVLTIVVIVGGLMFVIEGRQHGFTSIPVSMYWAIVTLTTVGYGDIAPQTIAGKFIAAILMLLGYGIIAVPTGIVTAELSQAAREAREVACPACAEEGHDQDAEFCKHCGAALEREEPEV